MAAYALLRGKDLRKSFTPITNHTKLANGQTAEQGLEQAVSQLRWQLRQASATSISSGQGALPSSTQRLAEYLMQQGDHK